MHRGALPKRPRPGLIPKDFEKQKCENCGAQIQFEIYVKNEGLCLWCLREQRKAAENSEK